MPFVVTGKAVSETTLENGRKINKAFLVLNVLIPFLYLVDSVCYVTMAEKFSEL